MRKENDALQCIIQWSGLSQEETAVLDTMRGAMDSEHIQLFGNIIEKVHAAMLHFQNGTHQHFRRIHSRKKIEGYRILNDISIGATIFTLFEATIGAYSDNRYLAADWKIDCPKPEYRNMFFGSYTDVLMNYYERINHCLEMLAHQKQTAHEPERLLYGRDCIENSRATMDFQGRLLVLLPVMLCPGYEYADNQLFYAASGPGCLPAASHREPIFGTLLASGETWSAWRSQVFGIIKPELVPAWAAEKVNQIRAVSQMPSLTEE